MESIVSSKIKKIKNTVTIPLWTPALISTWSSPSIFISLFAPLPFPLPLLRYPLFLSGSRNSRHSNREPTAKWGKEWKEKKRKERKRKEKKRVMLTRKGGGKGKFWAKNCTSCLPLKFSFSSVLFSTQRLVSLNFSWSFHLFLLSIPPALSLILHLSLHVLKLRANYSFWLYDTRSYVLLYVCVCVCSVCSPTPPLL